MVGLLVRTLITAAGLWVAARLVGGIQIEGTSTLLLSALLLGIVNAVIRPIAILLTLPITVLTLGLFLLVVNAAMLALVAKLVPEFQVAGFGSAVLGSLIVSATAWLASWYVGPRGQFEVMVVRRGA